MTAHPPAPSASPWKDIETSDLRAFTGLCICMGILRLPRRHHYWRATKWLFKTNFPSVMSRNKFDFMWRYIHLQDNTVPAPTGEKVWKLRWFLNHLTTRFQEVYTPYQNCTIDQSMIKFKGHLSFRQYLPGKPIKWGIKVWVLCESDPRYVSNMQVYTGKVEGRQEKGMAHRVCMDLLTPVMGTMTGVSSSVKIGRTVMKKSCQIFHLLLMSDISFIQCQIILFHLFPKIFHLFTLVSLKAVKPCLPISGRVWIRNGGRGL